MPLIPEPEPVDEIAEHRQLRENLKLRPGLATEKAVQVALVEDGYRYYYANIMLGLRKGSRGGRVDRTAVRLFEKALERVGHIAQPVQKLFDELGVESFDQLRTIVDAYRLGERATDEDRFELSLQTLEQHIRRHPEDGDTAMARVRVLVGKEGA